MKKPDVVCVVGSAVASPVLLTAFVAGELFLLNKWVVLDWVVLDWVIPDWLGWTATAIAALGASWWIAAFYRILFHRCQKAGS